MGDAVAVGGKASVVTEGGQTDGLGAFKRADEAFPLRFAGG